MSVEHAVPDNVRLYSPGTGSRAHLLVSLSARFAAGHEQSDTQKGQKYQTLATLFLRQTYRCVYDGENKYTITNQTSVYYSFIDTNLIHNSYLNYIKLNASTCFERHPPILRGSVSLINP